MYDKKLQENYEIKNIYNLEIIKTHRAAHHQYSVMHIKLEEDKSVSK